MISSHLHTSHTPHDVNSKSQSILSLLRFPYVKKTLNSQIWGTCRPEDKHPLKSLNKVVFSYAAFNTDRMFGYSWWCLNLQFTLRTKEKKENLTNLSLKCRIPVTWNSILLCVFVLLDYRSPVNFVLFHSSPLAYNNQPLLQRSWPDVWAPAFFFFSLWEVIQGFLKPQGYFSIKLWVMKMSHRMICLFFLLNNNKIAATQPQVWFHTWVTLAMGSAVQFAGSCLKHSMI